MKGLNELAKEVFRNAKEKGFHETKPNIGEMLMLIVSELSEALEADRKDNYVCDSELWQCLNGSPTDEDWIYYFEEGIKDTFEDEIADTFIRLLDLCAHLDIDIEKHIEAKMKYNSLRKYKHGGKKY